MSPIRDRASTRAILYEVNVSLFRTAQSRFAPDRLICKMTDRLDTSLTASADAEHRTSSGRRAISERRHHKWTDEFIQGQRWTATLQVRGQVVGVGTASKIAAAREIALDE